MGHRKICAGQVLRPHLYIGFNGEADLEGVVAEDIEGFEHGNLLWKLHLLRPLLFAHV
jgi:hypothetical protein